MKILFIGNRINVLTQLLHNNIDIFVLKGSYLHRYLKKLDVEYHLFDLSDKEMIVNKVMGLDHDVVISNGCPFILPVVHGRMYNIHPTYLPLLRGKTPLNGVLLYGYNFIGATMHIMSPTVDGGNIIYQEKQEISPALDLGLIYFMSFHLEGQVFKKGWQKLLSSNFEYRGTAMEVGEGTYYNRNDNDRIVDFKKMNSSEILKRIKAFGISTQGAIVKGLGGGEEQVNLIYEAEKLEDEYLSTIFSNHKPNNIVLKYDNKIIIKTIDGLLKVSKYA